MSPRLWWWLPALLGLALLARPGHGADVPAPGLPAVRAAVLPAPAPAPMPPQVQVLLPPADDATALSNPGRGLSRQAWDMLPRLRQIDAANAYANGYRLLHARVDLGPWRGTALPPALLQQLEQAFALARTNGIKLIPRFVYSDPDRPPDEHVPADAPLERVQAHLQQLAPVLRRNADVIALVEAGFIGHWGDWGDSSYGLDTRQARQQVRDALLQALPPELVVAFGQSGQLLDWYPGLPQPQQAFDGSASARSAYQSGCLLADGRELGQDSADPAAVARLSQAMAARARIAPAGALACDPLPASPAGAGVDCQAMLAYGAAQGLTYLDDSDGQAVAVRGWRAQGCHGLLRARLGYRLVLEQVRHSTQLRPGQALALTLQLHNAGWARPFTQHTLRVLLRHRDSGQVLALQADGVAPGRWRAGARFSHALQLPLPAQAASGPYEVLLALPDAAPSLAQDPRFAIRFANADAPGHGQGWDEALGAYRLGSTVTLH